MGGGGMGGWLIFMEGEANVHFTQVLSLSDRKNAEKIRNYF